MLSIPGICPEFLATTYQSYTVQEPSHRRGTSLVDRASGQSRQPKRVVWAWSENGSLAEQPHVVLISGWPPAALLCTQRQR